MGTTCEMPICGTCGADWATGEWNADCAECGGGSMTIICPACGGECGAVFQRDITQSHAMQHAVWVGACALQDQG